MFGRYACGGPGWFDRLRGAGEAGAIGVVVTMADGGRFGVIIEKTATEARLRA
ncbi:hypothetical protein GCM10017771_85000 [Streptomyces capitiformicae]|uniref:Uncharacterized protein n=1 Tax=Streptomyces capitiformicae TaxID=2014920 RepID=A0A918ZND9_9ACTN|nr:hypothetical protein GCM10017771_85000 [Streptomyces capitiformicae]